MGWVWGFPITKTLGNFSHKTKHLGKQRKKMWLQHPWKCSKLGMWMRPGATLSSGRETSLPMAGSWNKSIFKVHSKPNHSVILCVYDKELLTPSKTSLRSWTFLLQVPWNTHLHQAQHRVLQLYWVQTLLPVGHSRVHVKPVTEDKLGRVSRARHLQPAQVGVFPCW